MRPGEQRVQVEIGHVSFEEIFLCLCSSLRISLSVCSVKIIPVFGSPIPVLGKIGKETNLVIFQDK